MIDLAKSALNCAWALSVFGAQEALKLMNPAGLARGTHSMGGGDDAHASPFAMMGALDPLRWLDAGTRVLQPGAAPAPQLEPPIAMPSVLESPADYAAHSAAPLHFEPAPAPAPAPEAPRPAPTGWGPMP